jgi:HEPN domain-containing protein
MATERDLARRLLQRATEDEAAARAMLPVQSVTDMIVGTLAQQAVEKSIKAVLSFNAVRFPFVHDIGRLATLASDAGAPLPDSLRDVHLLTAYAGALRYDSDDPKSVDRQTALRWATAAVAWARTHVEAATQPAAADEGTAD